MNEFGLLAEFLTDSEKLKYLYKNLSQVIFLTTNPIHNARGSNLGLHDTKPVTNCLSYGTATN
jgi:hypothetical protein